MAKRSFNCKRSSTGKVLKRAVKITGASKPLQGTGARKPLQGTGPRKPMAVKRSRRDSGLKGNA